MPVDLTVNIKTGRLRYNRRVAIKHYNNESSDSDDEMVGSELVMNKIVENAVENNRDSGARLNVIKQYKNIIKRDSRPDWEVDEKRRVYGQL